jgi:arylsulfatase A-like enzyme
MTGRHPVRYGVFSAGSPLRPQELTLAKVLQSAGYSTGHFGKWHLNGKSGDRNTTNMPGRAILVSDPLSPGKFGFDEWVSADNFFDLDPVLGRNGVPEKFHGDGSDITTDLALEFIRRKTKEEKPFLAVVWFGNPHTPHLALAKDKALYASLPEKDQNYYGEITGVDRSVGRLRAALRELKVADNTLLWYCSDNGGINGPKSTGNLRGQKGTVWEGGVRVPGLVEWPARIPKPFRSEMPCSTLDIYPTILEATGVVAKNQINPLDGVSLISLFDRKTEVRTKPIPFWFHGNAVNQKPGHAALLDWPYKLHTEPAGNRAKAKETTEVLPAVLLYDVSKDPKETTDLAGQQPERVKKMATTLAAWKGSVEKSLGGADYPAPLK